LQKSGLPVFKLGATAGAAARNVAGDKHITFWGNGFVPVAGIAIKGEGLWGYGHDVSPVLEIHHAGGVRQFVSPRVLSICLFLMVRISVFYQVLENSGWPKANHIGYKLGCLQPSSPL
jgi:hypothetical protein